MAGPDEIKPYLPERYRQRIREKYRRRTLIRILCLTVIIGVAAVLLFSLSQILGTGLPAIPVASPSQPVTGSAAAAATSPIPPTPAGLPPSVTTRITTQPVPETTAPPAAGYTIEPGVPEGAASGSLSRTGAETALRNYYPEDAFTIRRVNYSADPSRSLFGFTLEAAGSPSIREDTVVFIDAVTGIPWAAGEETAAFPRERVKGVVLAEFPGTSASTTSIWYHDGPSHGSVWRFILASGNMTLASGSVDAATGEILAFTRNIPYSGRPADPVFTREKAQSIASKYVTDHNGDLSLNLTSSGYIRWGTESVPAAGAYTFSWDRLYLDYPVDIDGITVTVDALTGDVIGYDKRWTTSDYAFSQTVIPSVAQRDATYAVMDAAKAVFPESIESVRILSSELRWNNGGIPKTAQRPGSIPLAWKVIFDDEILRTNTSLAPGIAWVDIQTGNVTAIKYRH